MNSKLRWMSAALLVILTLTFVGATTTTQAASDKGGTPKVASIAKVISDALLNATAQATGLSTTDIKAKLKDGSSLADVITAMGADVNKVEAAAKSDATTAIQNLVKDGTITQARADKVIAQLDTRLNRLLNRKHVGKHQSTTTPTPQATPSGS
jgi:hypothetical protein